MGGGGGTKGGVEGGGNGCGLIREVRRARGGGREAVDRVRGGGSGG